MRLPAPIWKEIRRNRCAQFGGLWGSVLSVPMISAPRGRPVSHWTRSATGIIVGSSVSRVIHQGGRGRVTCASGGDGALLSWRLGSNAAGPRNERSTTEGDLRLSADFFALGEGGSSTVAVCSLSSGLNGGAS